MSVIRAISQNEFARIFIEDDGEGITTHFSVDERRVPDLAKVFVQMGYLESDYCLVDDVDRSKLLAAMRRWLQDHDLVGPAP